MFVLPPKALSVRDEVKAFFDTRILPNHILWQQQVYEGQSVPEIENILRSEAKALGLWNMALPRLGDDEPGLRLSTLEFTVVAEVLGQLEWASRVFNCHAPDVPNMELLQLFGSEEQKERWLTPLLEGEFGSAFAMTEPEVASSDPTNLTTRIVRDGDEWVINGRKWFASNASHANCKFLIVVGVTDPDGAKSQRQSLVIVPVDTEGVRFVRNLPVFSHTSPHNTHPELVLEDVRVPIGAMLGEQGAGFAIGQARLGPARLHHCMRAIGECEVLISLMVMRSKERFTFGQHIESYSSTREAVALSRIETDQARLLVQQAAHLLDTVGSRVARKQISMIKVAVARCYQSIADRAIQLFGARGVTDDTPAARAFTRARAFRIYDGPDEVHLQTISKIEANEQDLTGMEHYLSTDHYA